MRVLSRLGDGIWYLILAGIVFGFGYTVWQEVGAVLPIIPARIALTSVAPVAAVVGLLALMVLTEVLYPLRALSGNVGCTLTARAAGCTVPTGSRGRS